ncbi:uncharacterized protein LOC123307696 [Coccinella septempunctata]|uniref:uncharacterized protein LOC123307696 n=1 Tax=Coccinella septempunctata TaxID=41139 RepID=UPI001D05F708|nr:uncharacterized protein LOC123307696 [Coccinella septempunctata]
MNLYFVILVIVISIYYIPITIAGLSVCHIHKIISLRSRYLVKLLKKLDFNSRRVKETKSEIFRCVQIHMEIRNVVHAFNESLGYVAASSQNACNNLMIGMCAYLIIKEDRYIYIFSIVMWTFLQWISCYSGQAVEDANELVRIELYNTTWYEMDPSLRSTFKIFQAQVSLPIRLKVKPLQALSMEHLTNVTKGAYSILMFLLRI